MPPCAARRWPGGKPAPDAYLLAAAEIGVPPSDCLAVEDSPNGIRPATAAGMPVLAIPRGGAALPAAVAHLPAAQAPNAAAALPLLTRLLTPRPGSLIHEAGPWPREHGAPAVYPRDSSFRAV